MRLWHQKLSSGCTAKEAPGDCAERPVLVNLAKPIPTGDLRARLTVPPNPMRSGATTRRPSLSNMGIWNRHPCSENLFSSGFGVLRDKLYAAALSLNFGRISHGAWIIQAIEVT